MPLLDPTVTLSSRQEAFCRHFVASGNAADAARRAGYAEGSARQTGCALLERPYIVERVRRIRMSWRRTEKDEARIALARLEQAWDAAVASGSAYLMLQVVRLQAEIAGLTRPAGANRARLWPMPEEDEFGEMEAGEAHEAGTEPGPLAEAVRSGRDRAGRALARHRESREERERQEGFDEAAHEETARKLAEAVEERERLPVCFQTSPSSTTRPRTPTKTASGPATTRPATRTGSMTTGPTAQNTTGSTSAETASLKSTTPGPRRLSSSGDRTGSNGKRCAAATTRSSPANRRRRAGPRTENPSLPMTSHDIS